jgi:hypothetical protein
MASFTYKAPDDKAFFAHLYKYIQILDDKELASLLSGGKCVINTTTTYSHNRWDACDASIVFSIPIDSLSKVNEAIKKRLFKYCFDVFPADAGYDLKEVTFSPVFQIETQDNLLDNLEFNLELGKNGFQLLSLDQEVKDKGNEMAEAYTYLYWAENMLRKYIITIAKLHFGSSYPSKLQFNRTVRDKIAQRKREEERNTWVSVRGDSDIYYLDFVELADVIINNWDIFKSHFPDQAWIKTKIDDMYKCRCLVAHNSYISKHDRDVIRVNFTSIIKQINGSLKGDPNNFPF